jgi:hypothetical protein
MHVSTSRIPITVGPTGQGGADWSEFPELQVPFMLSRKKAVAAFLHLSDHVAAVPGGYILVRLKLDGNALPASSAITGETERYRTASSVWMGEIEAGSHLMKVEYRSGSQGTNHPLVNDFHGRALYLVELACSS